MKAARIVVLGVAVAAGGLAALLASRSDPPAPQPPVEPVAKLDTIEILVAKADVGMGQAVSPQELQWQTWPMAAAGPTFIRKSEQPDAIQSLSGSIARTPFVVGEPIREAKLIKANGSGFMAAILPSGMRAVSTEISPETGAGGFILPNDHVDVLLSRRDKDAEKQGRGDAFLSETILTNIRVLAIDQAVEEKNGQKVVIGKTATLELTPRQTETLALSRQQGTLSLALRSIIDTSGTPKPTVEDDSDKKKGSVNMVRFGVTTSTSAK